MPRPHYLFAYGLAVLCLAYPWLNPFNLGPSVTVVSGLVAWSCAVGLGLCFITLLTTREARWRVLLVGWALAAGLSALMGLLQYFDRAHGWWPWVNNAGLGQAFANMRQRNHFATLCSIGLVVLWWCAQYAQAGKRHTALTAGWLAGAVLVCAGSAASGSRTGFLQLVLLCMLAWCWRPGAGTAPGTRRGLALAGCMVVAYVLAAVLLPLAAGVQGSVFERMREAPGCTSRVALYRNVLDLIAQKPLTGWGLGELDFAHFMTLYTSPLAGMRFCEILDNAHNLPLHWAVELGLPLACLLCALLGLWLLHHKPWAERQPQRQLAWGLLAMVGLHSLLEYPLWYGPFQVTMVLCLWVLHAHPAGHTSNTALADLPYATDVTAPQTRSGPAVHARWMALLALALLCALVTWNYWRMSQLYMAPQQRAPAYRDDTYGKVLGTWFFGNHVDFAVFSVTPVNAQTAPYLLELGERLLHFSPEAKVVEKLLDAAIVLQREDKVALYAPRFAAAFPEDYQRWHADHPDLLLP